MPDMAYSRQKNEPYTLPPPMKPKVVNKLELPTGTTNRKRDSNLLELQTLNVILIYSQLIVGGAAARARRMRNSVLLAGKYSDYTAVGFGHS